MKVAIRVDASRFIGTGHVMRCLVLAQKLKEHGHDVVMLSRELEGNFIAYSQQQGIDVIALNAIQQVAPSAPDDYQHWLGVSLQEDASECLAKLNDFHPNWIVVDHYAIEENWHSAIKACGASILAIDDLANRPLNCEIVLDHNPWPDFENRYNAVIPTHCTPLLGPKYGLLRPTFATLRTNPVEPLNNQVIAFFSGTDPSGECLKLLNASQKFSELPFELTIVFGMANPRKDELLSEPLPPFVTLTEVLPDFEADLAACRYAFGGAGVSAIERASLGVPGTLVSVAENQRLMAEHLASSGIYRYLGNSDLTTANTYFNELTWLSDNWESLPHRLPPSDIDGNGAERVVAEMESEKITFRPMVVQDLSMVRNWRNAPEIREKMFSQHVIQPEEHERWFASIQGDESKQFFIALSQGKPVGMMSFTGIKDGTAEWGFYKSPDAPAGTGKQLLYESLVLGFECLGLNQIDSRVLAKNPKVLHLHEVLGFQKNTKQQTMLRADGSETPYYAFHLTKADWQKDQRAKNMSGKS
ncbi:UDP-2,4-diacetamido-2,4,6-trideoxy-beta-L-altropyranose hydrolase [Enterovibrio sp. ZSDZ35]|uniref:UDP-2,4-diacetamido-2,4, 6-trideoxy-beta-L-altropyranose hydrolase n=1 Tax=Enterovibrio qingdaonensis TaxID=2899818 RepID=A0ABT5QR40_9GAMM|nr:UDP-2,4-diacetamido-2,4,6-trideoxy-beta-L-altropyranose hydrolase [Enterovibrio sp. ZSDZ35]MDD1783059.1 UDP-2,4-diacetamido-2,4,6-trideoxy-beta-L-altropyranose hydrolase [Enterovibrio sp. ZSDZ35]